MHQGETGYRGFPGPAGKPGPPVSILKPLVALPVPLSFLFIFIFFEHYNLPYFFRNMEGRGWTSPIERAQAHKQHFCLMYCVNNPVIYLKVQQKRDIQQGSTNYFKILTSWNLSAMVIIFAQLLFATPGWVVLIELLLWSTTLISYTACVNWRRNKHVPHFFLGSARFPRGKGAPGTSGENWCRNMNTIQYRCYAAVTEWLPAGVNVRMNVLSVLYFFFHLYLHPCNIFRPGSTWRWRTERHSGCTGKALLSNEDW